MSLQSIGIIVRSSEGRHEWNVGLFMICGSDISYLLLFPMLLGYARLSYVIAAKTCDSMLVLAHY